MRRVIFLAIGLGWVLYSAAFAQVTISDSIIHFEKGQKYQTLYVRNLSHYKTFTVNTVALEVISPGDPKTELKPVTDLFAAPSRFIIQPRSEIPLKIFYNRDDAIDSQKVYKLRFIPQMEALKPEGNSQLITVITGVGALIFVEPDDKKPKISWEREGNVITLLNEGNVNVEVLRKDICHSKKPEICHFLSGKRLYQNGSYQFVLPEAFQSENIDIDLMININKQRVTVPVEAWGLDS
ncbi:MAG: hypothetical protein OSB62_08830 [Alphaproteobacteria bacterium]|nr:hypothetical protein [Alphaproteobacteria bacterium]